MLNYTTFLPFLSKSGREDFWGLAYALPGYSADYKKLNVDCYYTWGPWASPGIDVPFTPMLWSGDPDSYSNLWFDANYSGDLLWMNEPNVQAQLNCSPEIAIERLVKTKQRFPKARLIGPNHSCFAYDWIVDFRQRMLLLPPEFHIKTWGIHGYMEWDLGAEHIIKMIENNHLLTGGDYWITEFGEVHGYMENFKTFCNWILENRSWIKRAFVYTNRQPDPATNSWVISSNVDLIDGDGNLKPMGSYYAGLSR